MPGPLDGVRVVELSHEHVAFAGKQLADLGATVTVVEPPGGSAQRTYGPFLDDEPGPERSLWWWHYNTSKRGVVADLTTDDGAAAVRALVGAADVLLVGERPDVLEAAGLDWPSRSAADGRLVMASVTPFGATSARSAEPVTDLTLLAEGGPVWSCGYDDHTLPPVRGGGNQALHTAGNWATVSILVALLAREETGVGQHVDVSMYAAANVTTEMATYGWLMAGAEVQRQTGRHAAPVLSPPVQVRCADGRYATTGVPPRDPRTFAAILDLLDRFDLRDEFPSSVILQLGAELDAPLNFADVLTDPLVAEIVTAGRDVVWFLGEHLPAYEFFVETQSIGLATGIIYTPGEAMADPHFVARGFPAEIDHPELGRTITYPGAPYRFTATPWSARRAPSLGEHQVDLAPSRSSGDVAEPPCSTRAVTETRGPAASPPAFDPFDPVFRADPYPFYAALREHDPVHRTPFGFVVLTRYDDVVRTLRGNGFSRDVEANAPTDDPGTQRRREQLRRRREAGEAAKSILNLDPPDHTRLRRLVSLAFTPSAIERLRPRIEQLVDGILDRAAEQGSMELVDELAFPVPFQVISDLLGMPTEREGEIRAWSQSLTAALEPTADDATMAAADTAVRALGGYLDEVITDRRRHPGDDLLSQLLVVEEAGDRLTTAELRSFVVLLYVAGHETTVNLIGNGLLALLRHPDELRRWRDDPGLDAVAVDELLRFDGPVQQTVRVPIETVRYRDVEISPGTIVMTVLGAANHDPTMFEEPDRLHLDRPNANRHLAFASGIHYCLGASLAKLEATVSITSVIRRFPELELTGEPRWRDRLTIRGVDRLPLGW